MQSSWKVGACDDDLFVDIMQCLCLLCVCGNTHAQGGRHACSEA
jgi:hypothetical protein